MKKGLPKSKPFENVFRYIHVRIAYLLARYGDDVCVKNASLLLQNKGALFRWPKKS
jgi:hypothetical protein